MRLFPSLVCFPCTIKPPHVGTGESGWEAPLPEWLQGVSAELGMLFGIVVTPSFLTLLPSLSRAVPMLGVENSTKTS